MYINDKGNYRENIKKDYVLSAYFRVFDKTTSDFVSYLQIFSFYKTQNFSILDIVSNADDNVDIDNDIKLFYENPKLFIEKNRFLENLNYKKEVSNSRLFVVK